MTKDKIKIQEIPFFFALGSSVICLPKKSSTGCEKLKLKLGKSSHSTNVWKS